MRNSIYTEKRNYTYNDVKKMTNKTANALRELGLRIDDRIMLLCWMCLRFMPFSGVPRWALHPFRLIRWWHHLITNITWLTAGRNSFCLRAMLPVVNQIEGDLPYLRDVIVVSEESGVFIPFRQSYRRAPTTFETVQTSADDVAFWLYSSGSTGSPKGAIHSQIRYGRVSRVFWQKF